MELADAHAHFFRDGFETRYGVLFPDGKELALYQGIRREHHIGDVLAIGYEGDALYNGNNRYLAEIAALHSWLHPLAFVHAEQPPTAADYAQLQQERFEGLSLYLMDAQHAEAFARWPSELIAALNAQRTIISINTACHHLSRIDAALERLDGCRVLVSHLGLPENLGDSSIEEKMRPATALARLPHVGMKASAFYSCGALWHDYPHTAARPVFQTLFAAFGPERLYWGSDFSPALEHISIPQAVDILKHLNLSPHDEAAIFGGNLRRLLACS